VRVPAEPLPILEADEGQVPADRRSPPGRPQRCIHLALVAVLLLGRMPRLWRVYCGLPYLYHPPKPVTVAMAQMPIACTPDWLCSA
jgi:hypothetical protein